MNAEFQRIARRDKKAFLSNQCKEIEENNRMGKTRDVFKKIRDNKGTFHAKMGTIKDRMGNFPGGSDGKASAYNGYHVGDLCSIPGSGRSPGEGNGNLLQYSCLENPKDRGAGQAKVHGVAKSWARLSNSHLHLVHLKRTM